MIIPTERVETDYLRGLLTSMKQNVDIEQDTENAKSTPAITLSVQT